MFRNEEAVSPVIGVILMVAITVIISAVVAAFIFGMAGNMDNKAKVVGFHADKESADKITVTNMGGHDSESLVSVVVDTPSVSPIVKTGDASVPGGTVVITPAVSGAFAAKTQVTVTGTFGDGYRQVLLDTYL